ncbi:MAG: PilZ domain-containing protein [Anaerolineales bacterium]|nr:PilZ domain-containing protein [Anaerolineales bacterium]
MKERRTLERKYLMVYSRVFDRITGKILGYLSDLSPKGAMIISDDPLTENSILSLRFDLPDPLLFPTDHLNLQARVAWCKPDIDPSFYNIGFEFLEVSEQQKAIIEDMIVAYEFRRDLPNYPISPASLET